MAARKLGKASTMITARLTPEERRDLKWLARKRGYPEAETLRQLVAEELTRLVEAGVKVPRR